MESMVSQISKVMKKEKNIDEKILSGALIIDKPRGFQGHSISDGTADFYGGSKKIIEQNTILMEYNV